MKLYPLRRNEVFMIITVQYLEPGSKDVPVNEAQDRLRQVLTQLAVGGTERRVLLGWALPDELIDAVAEVCKESKVDLYRWHPLLSGNEWVKPDPALSVIGLDGAAIPGHGGMAEFTFMCPNRPETRERVREGLAKAAADHRYQGIFLDRMRFPSPAENPLSHFGCFCEHCQQLEDLEPTRQQIMALFDSTDGIKAFICELCGSGRAGNSPLPGVKAMRKVQAFRMKTITHLLHECRTLYEGKLGFDVFSTSIAPWVGQDMTALHQMDAWIKIMCYGHTYGPAGLPFELGALVNWLETHCAFTRQEALDTIIEAAGFQPNWIQWHNQRLDCAPALLRLEAVRARRAGAGDSPVLAGIELVDMPEFVNLSPAQICADLAAFKSARVDGLALSWDAWLIPPEHIALVREALV
jgi:hypothetical protein